MANIPKIDVFIPVFNDKRYIGRAINSCLDQAGVDVRVLVSDNCSTDGTFEVVSAIAENDDRVVVHRNEENIGMIKNLHRLQELVDRPYYMFLCSDDFLLDKNAFSAAVSLFDKNPELVSIYSNIDFLDANGKKIITNAFARGEIFDPLMAMKDSLITTRNKFGIPLLHKTKYAILYPFLEDINYSSDLWHSYKVGSHGLCGHVNRSCIGNTYNGENLTRSLMKDAYLELRSLAELEDIRLTTSEKIRQYFNHYKTVFLKYLFFRVMIPLKIQLNH